MYSGECAQRRQLPAVLSPNGTTFKKRQGGRGARGDHIIVIFKHMNMGNVGATG